MYQNKSYTSEAGSSHMASSHLLVTRMESRLILTTGRFDRWLPLSLFSPTYNVREIVLLANVNAAPCNSGKYGTTPPSAFRLLLGSPSGWHTGRGGEEGGCVGIPPSLCVEGKEGGEGLGTRRLEFLFPLSGYLTIFCRHR